MGKTKKTSQPKSPGLGRGIVAEVQITSKLTLQRYCSDSSGKYWTVREFTKWEKAPQLSYFTTLKTTLNHCIERQLVGYMDCKDILERLEEAEKRILEAVERLDTSNI